MSHRCEPGWNQGTVEEVFACRIWGPAIERCYQEDTGEFWVDNGKHSTRVNYCPFCGAKAPNQVDWTPLANQATEKAMQTLRASVVSFLETANADAD